MRGVLAIDKPTGWTSRDVVNRVQRLVRQAGKFKVGHTGTLDPMATGVLLVAVGAATRLVEFAHEAIKHYRAEFQLGCRSDTLDTDGQVCKLDNAPRPTADQWRSASQKWIGRVRQVPPKYSAIQVDGRRAYERARAGQDFELPSRHVHIHSIKTVSFNYPHVTVDIACSAGTYVRSLGSDIAVDLGSDAVMSGLVRTAIEPLELSDCVSLAALESWQDVQRSLHPATVLVPAMPKIELTDQLCRDLRNGLVIDEKVLRDEVAQNNDRWAALDSTGQLVAVIGRCESSPGQWHYRSLRVLPNASFPIPAATSQPNRISTPQRPES